MDSSENLNPQRLSAKKLKSFFRNLSISSRRIEEKKKLKQGIKMQIEKLKAASASKGAMKKDELMDAVERLEQKLNLLIENKKTLPKRAAGRNVFEDIFKRIELLSAKVNALGNIIENSEQAQKKIDPERIYELEQKINKKLEKISTSLKL